MAIEILRPNGAGDETSISTQQPFGGAHWDKVDEVVADDGTTTIATPSTSYQRDLYSLPTSSGTGTIIKITVYFVAAKGLSNGSAKASIKSGTTVSDGDEHALTGLWAKYSHEWALNPDNSAAWEWEDIDALQIGVSLISDGAPNSLFCTQVYVEVDHTPRWIGTIGGKDIGSIAKFCGKSVTDIAVIGGISNV